MLRKEARPWEVDLGVPTIKGEVVKSLVAVRLRRMKSKYLVFRMKSYYLPVMRPLTLPLKMKTKSPVF